MNSVVRASPPTPSAVGIAGSNEAVVLRMLMARRKVTRHFTGRTIDRSLLEALTEAVALAPSGGARRPVRTLVADRPSTIGRIAAFAPGIIGRPTAVMVLSIDWNRAPHLARDERDRPHTLHVDLGTALQNVLLLAEASGLGACPVTSFHRASIRSLLNLPASWTPIVLVVLGFKRDETAAEPGDARRLEEPHWNRYQAGDAGR